MGFTLQLDDIAKQSGGRGHWPVRILEESACPGDRMVYASSVQCRGLDVDVDGIAIAPDSDGYLRLLHRLLERPE